MSHMHKTVDFEQLVENLSCSEPPVELKKINLMNFCEFYSKQTAMKSENKTTIV